MLLVLFKQEADWQDQSTGQTTILADNLRSLSVFTIVFILQVV